MENNLLQSLEEKLKAKFADAVISSEQSYDFPLFVVKREKVFDIIKFLKENPETQFGFLTTLCGLHYPDNKGNELGVMYQLHNLPKNWRIRIKTFFPVTNPEVPSLTPLFPSANWQERQEYDFFGIIFKGHPNLKRILNMDEMNYFPMRKEYALEDAGRDDKNDTMFGR
ncbi:MAG TPA: NADH-quinone oxidoreductase subunit C [Bacteroidia bacterium]|jgi:NADH-quinone oxidoreductase subunit C|nr:NADH-quinone oxidoreductase subunit C [Bacteroidia bacterium]